MLTIGLDVHQSGTAVCILDDRGVAIKEVFFRGHPRDLVGYLRDTVAADFQVCFEASCGSGTLHDLLADVAARVVVAHPGELRLIFRSKKKNDRVDAAKLARLLYLDDVPQVHVPDIDARAWRELIVARDRAVAQRTRVKNGLRSLLRSSLIKAPRNLWTKKNVEWLRELELPTEIGDFRRDVLMLDLEHACAQVARLERRLDEIGRRHPGVQLLQTIPGVGPRTAEAVCAFVDDPHRFTAKRIGSYLGLVPRQDQSGKINRMGRITRDGPAVVRRLLTEATWRSIRHSPTVAAFNDRIQRGDNQRRKKALVATSHYMARVMVAMLQTGRSWEETPQRQTRNAA